MENKIKQLSEMKSEEKYPKELIITKDRIESLIKEEDKFEENKEIIIALLNKLLEMKISAEEINTSKFSKSLKILLTKETPEIASLTKKLILKWKGIVHQRKQEIEKTQKKYIFSKSSQIEVIDLREDSILEEKRKTFLRLLEEEKVPFRKSSKILIFNSLIKCEKDNKENYKQEQREVHVEQEEEIIDTDAELVSEIKYENLYDLTLKIEEGVYEFFNEESTKYLKHVKSIVMNLQNNKVFMKDVLSGKLTGSQIGSMNPKDFASVEAKQRRQKLEEDAFKARRSDWNRLQNQNLQGFYRCGKCKTNKTTYYQVQIRRADEPMTTFVTCLECNNSWKF